VHGSTQTPTGPGDTEAGCKLRRNRSCCFTDDVLWLHSMCSHGRCKPLISTEKNQTFENTSNCCTYVFFVVPLDQTSGVKLLDCHGDDTRVRACGEKYKLLLTQRNIADWCHREPSVTELRHPAETAAAAKREPLSADTNGDGANRPKAILHLKIQTPGSDAGTTAWQPRGIQHVARMNGKNNNKPVAPSATAG